jgi:DNA-binding HxlR family transcriptional regulator
MVTTDRSHCLRRQRKGREECPIEDLFVVLGGLWKVVLIWHLDLTPKRFMEIHRELPEISRKMLTQQLRQLEADGLVKRKVHATVPPRVEYSLTKMGDGLKPLLKRMHDWTTENYHQFKRLQKVARAT